MPLPSLLRLPDRRFFGPVLIIGLQTVAAVYFVFDGINELIEASQIGMSWGVLLECMVALALLCGVALGFRYIGSINRELHRKEQALATAKGALAEHVALRFAEWGLSPGEGDVALFALKGCDVAEIARLRGAAMGTVRSQLSQIYAKAEVSSQAMFVSLFIEDLIDNPQ